MRTSEAGHYVLGAAELAQEMPRRARTPPRAVSNLGELAPPDLAFSSSLGPKCWFAAPNTFDACEAVMTKGSNGPGENHARFTVEKLRVNRGDASASQLKRTVTDADRAGAAVSKVADPVADTRGLKEGPASSSALRVVGVGL